MGDDTTVQARPRGGAPPLGDLGDLGDREKKPTTPRSPRAATPFAGTPFAGTPPGAALGRKKSYHPELRVAAAAAGVGATVDSLADSLTDDPISRREMFVLPRDGGHKMELIHLNRTCTSVDLAQQALDGHQGLDCSPDARRASGTALLAEEERVHRVRHQVSFAQDVGIAGTAGSAAAPRRLGGHLGNLRGQLRGEELISALRSKMMPVVSDPDRAEDVEDDEQDDDDEAEEEEDDDDDEAPFGFTDSASGLSPGSDKDYLAVRPSLASTQLNNEIRGPTD